MITDEINTLVHDFTIQSGAVPAPLNYRGFPKSVCVSVNEVICHGIPGPRVLHEGDIVNVDVTPILNGYYADVSKTFFLGRPGPRGQEDRRVARECLRRALAVVRSGNTIGDIGYAIQGYAEGEGCSVVREFVGHGVGFGLSRTAAGAPLRAKGRGHCAHPRNGFHRRAHDQPGGAAHSGPGGQLDRDHRRWISFSPVRTDHPCDGGGF